jgi:hypothetical protein
MNVIDIALENSRTPGLAQRGFAILAQDYSFGHDRDQAESAEPKRPKLSYRATLS